MEELFNQIANVGFPIAISCYLLIRIEFKISELTKSINDLSNSISTYNH
ncbi:YvrJ family protein [Peptoniphilus stercorisuis]|uniref:YvrJ family protein n=1 Tax=Peptoniphilus stercorisuis TaxID=1436965 RepID=A0ABS4KB86_9FIRM|nr:YvrJ family protein [Peptoniphilus stercorisuis]MBP2024516.1 hypothetical protein [Peptoniphilus stercorisuis]